jgi:F0F1-type ATP synthase membrane subunit b/b'
LLKDIESKFKLSVENKKKTAEQKIEQMKVSAIKEIQQISNKITFDVVKDILNDSENKNHIEKANKSYLESIYSEISEKKLNL